MASLHVCTAADDNPDPSLPPRPVDVYGTGSSVFSLDARTSEGWLVSLVSGDLPPPAVLPDGGQLSGLVVGDTIHVTAKETCQPFSGCKSTVAVRDGRTDVLITAKVFSDAFGVEGFGDVIGARLGLEAICREPMAGQCFPNEVDMRNRLVFQAGSATASIEPGGRGPAILEGRPYTLWFSGARTMTGSGPSTCLDRDRLLGDQDAFFVGGFVTIQLTPGAP